MVWGWMPCTRHRPPSLPVPVRVDGRWSVPCRSFQAVPRGRWLRVGDVQALLSPSLGWRVSNCRVGSWRNSLTQLRSAGKSRKGALVMDMH